MTTFYNQPSDSSSFGNEHNETDEMLRKRVKALYSFLKAFNQLRNPTLIHVAQYPVSYRILDLPQHSNVKISAPCLEIPEADLAEASFGFELNVTKTELSECPAPPDKIVNFIHGNWSSETADILLTIPELDEQVDQVINPDDILESFQTWNELRNQWCQSELIAVEAKRLYEKLFSIYNEVQKDSESHELVIADGILVFSAEGRVFKHPILSRRLEIGFDAQNARVTLSEFDGITELYASLFQELPQVDLQIIGQLDDELKVENVSPVDYAETNNFLTQVVNQVFPNGRMSHSDTLPAPGDVPTLYRDPIIILRKRNLGYARMIENIVNDIEDGGEISRALKLVVGLETLSEDTEIIESSVSNYANEDYDVLFSLPANSEQLAIAKRLAQNGNVVVQGPPGTGKTHTIANLIGHLLAQGKSILVTSHTSQALNVLKDKIQLNLSRFVFLF